MPVDTSILVLFGLSFLAFVSNRILSRYLYMSAGVKRADVKTFLAHLRDLDIQQHRQQELMDWLEYRSGYAKEFYTMSRYYDICGLPAVFYILAMVILSAIDLAQYMWVAALAMAAVWAILTLLGVRYGKYIEAETSDYFDSSRYKPYQPEPRNIHTQADPYRDTTPTGPFACGDREKEKRHRFRYGCSWNIFVVILFLAFLLVPILSQKFSLPTASTPEATTHLQASQAPTQPSDSQVSKKYLTVSGYLVEAGFHPIDAVVQLSDSYPGIDLSRGLLVEEEGMHLEYLVLTKESQAQSLAQGLQHQLYELVVARDPEITEEAGDGYTLYAQETEGDYGVVVQDGTNILYAYCPQYDTTWMKWFLNDLGYLSTF